MQFHDRRDAGQQLAPALAAYRRAPHTIVIALPRGGVVVGAQIAETLEIPLDIVFPRKIGAPKNSEYAIGAITESGEPVWDTAALALLDVSDEYLDVAVATERTEIARRLRLYRGDRPPRAIHGMTTILVDDGVATGLTIRAAIRTLRQEGAARFILAVPVIATDTAHRLEHAVDVIVALHTPTEFGAVGQYYEQFAQVTDEEVITLLRGGSDPSIS